MPNIAKTGGATSLAKAGGSMTAPAVTFDPDNWLVSLFRSLKSYIETNEPGIYDIIGSFPSDIELRQSMPLRKTLIHFEIDDISNSSLGFGDSVVEEEYDVNNQLVIKQQATQHEVNFDLGIWASEASGGVTARLNAYQTLTQLFQGPIAFQKIKDNIGIEIVSFQNGAFVIEQIQDLNVWRVAGITLVVRVFSRQALTPEPSVEDLQPYSQLLINDTVVIG